MTDYLIVGDTPRTTLECRCEQLLEAFAPALRRLCAAYLPDFADQQDLFQEIALALWKALPKFRGDASQRTWLYRIAHNVALTYAGKRRLQSRSEQRLEEMAVEPGLLQDQRRRELMALVRQLPSMDRQLALLYLEGFSAREMEDVTGVPANNIAVRLSRLRHGLAAALNPKEVRQ